MKRLLIISIISLLLSSCCKNNNDNIILRKSTSCEEALKTQWTKVKIEDVKFNPFTILDKDWMLLSTENREDNNAMTIAWGEFGMLWSKPVVTVYVSSSRYSWDMLNKNQYFTVTAFPEDAREALQYMGSTSKRDVSDKASACGLHTEFTPDGHPIFSEANLAIECKKIYQKELDSASIPQEVFERFYQGGKNGIHSMYIGEIENIYTK
ncbi:MAG: flavin reductase [Bacteroidales bacterium]|nr:flavin reductase [Bacteroidales bacterium]